MASKKNNQTGFTVPGLSLKDGHGVAHVLQGRLTSLNDLQLTLKHAHWNVVGRDFIGVHLMLDPQIVQVRLMVDEIAERIAALGVSPNGLPGAMVRDRKWDDYSIGRADTAAHLAALDLVFDGVVASHREAIEQVGQLDPVSEDMLIKETGILEQFQWFIRAHLENSAGQLSTADTRTEIAAAKKSA